MNKKPLLIGAILFFGFITGICAGVAGLSLLDRTGWFGLFNPSKPAVKTAPELGHVAPEIELKDMSGLTLKLSDFRGQPVMVNFWATWCGPCREEVPYIEEAHLQYGDDLTILAVNAGEDLASVKQFAVDHALSFPILLDPSGKALRAYHPSGYPTTYFIDSDGIIQVIELGSMSRALLFDDLESIGVRP
jgi:thiol-disulfide isomerase/thioredoxin